MGGAEEPYRAPPASASPAGARPSLAIAGSSLRGAPFAAADWPVLAELFGDPRAARWLLRDPESADIEAQARRVAARFAESWAADGFGPYLLRLGARSIGYAGLRRSRLDARLETEALWAILPASQGAGRATQRYIAVATDTKRPRRSASLRVGAEVVT